MSTTLDKQLKGSNFCWMDCSERKAVIHPETCVKQVKITDNSDSTLEDWILRTSNNDEITDSMSSYTGLLNWLQTNYPVSGGSSTVSPATATTLGVIKTGEGNEWLSLDNNGVLTFNDSNLPTATINPATTSKLGGIYMGTDNIMSNYVFNPTSYTDIDVERIETLSDTLDNAYYAIPLRKDNKGKAGVIIPKRVLSAQVKANWEETNPNSNAYIQNKPELATVATSGDYNDLSGKPETDKYYCKEFVFSVNVKEGTSEAMINYTMPQLESVLSDYEKYSMVVKINLLNSFTDSQDDINSITNLIGAIEDLMNQYLSYRYFYNVSVIINFTFTYNSSNPVVLYVPIQYVSNNYTYLAIENNDYAAYDKGTNLWRIACPSDKRCSITIECNNTKATMNPNETTRLSSTIFSYKVNNYYQINTLNFNAAEPAN